MTDVRLTATDPADSSVVPVACNAKGELKLEEPIVFDGNLDGNLSVTGSANFDGTITRDATGDNHVFLVDRDGTQRMRIDPFGGIFIGDTNGDLTEANSNISLIADGNASFSGNVTTEATFLNELQSGYSPTGFAYLLFSGGSIFAEIKNNGSASFAGGKAGFTAEGYLWCTTRRGDTVILDATSNGLATWADYTPPTRREQLKEMAEEWSEKDKVDDDFGVSPEDAGET